MSDTIEICVQCGKPLSHSSVGIYGEPAKYCSVWCALDLDVPDDVKERARRLAVVRETGESAASQRH